VAPLSQREKTVRFYRPIMLDQSDQRINLPDNFWRQLMSLTESLAPQDRVLARTTGRYYGATRRIEDGGLPFMRIGVLRDKSDWPDTVEFSGASDELQALTLDGQQQLFESAFVVPFGGSLRIAVMPPIHGQVTPSGIGDWISFVAGHDVTDTRIELAPEVDKNVLEKLRNRATRLSKLTVRFPAGVDVPVSDMTNAGDSAKAVAMATQQRPLDASIEVTISTGNRSPIAAGVDMLEAAKSFIGLGADKLDVTMKLERANGETETEVHDVLQDKVTQRVMFSVHEDEKLTEKSVLTAINEAIETFQQQIT